MEHRSNLLQLALTCEWIAQHGLEQGLAIEVWFRQPEVVFEQGLMDAIPPAHGRLASELGMAEAQQVQIAREQRERQWLQQLQQALAALKSSRNHRINALQAEMLQPQPEL